MNHTLFTIEEENLICAFDMSSRTAVIADITAAMQYFIEPELYEIAENTLRKLNVISDAEYDALSLTPVYYDDESEV